MAIISDVELLAGFNVVVRWFAKASQRYPANENDYYSTTFSTLEPNEPFVLTDDRFILADINENPDDIEYIIRDLCHTQSLIPQNTGNIYFNPDYRVIATLANDANVGDTTIEIQDLVDSNLQPAMGDVIQIGLIQSQTRTITAINGSTITVSMALSFAEPENSVVSQANVVNSYPDIIASNTIARVLDNEGSLIADPLEVTAPLFYDTSETIRRYYYSGALDIPFNGALGSGDRTNQTLEHPPRSGNIIEAGWWATGDTDNSPASDAVLIDNQGFVIATRNMDHAFSLFLSFGGSESISCTSQVTTEYYGNHANFRGQTMPTPDPGTTSIINIDSAGTSPQLGYYSWVSTIASDNGQRFVKYWDGSAFLAGFVDTDFVDNCPIELQNSVTIHTYTSVQALACGESPTSFTVWFTGADTFGTAVDAIWTNSFGPNSDSPSALGAATIRVGGNGIGELESGETNYDWNGTTLTPNTADCLMSRFCGNPDALNTSSGDIRDDSLCEFARRICVDVDAQNYVPPGDRLATDVEVNSGSPCIVRDTRTATYNIQYSLIGPREGRSTDIVSDSGFDGDTYNISYEVRLNDGYEWIDMPDNLVGSNSAEWVGGNVSIPITITGEVRQIVEAPSGCNISLPREAANYTPGSIGDVDCYWGPEQITIGSTDVLTCDGSLTDGLTTANVYFDNQTVSYANGVSLYSDTAGTALPNTWAKVNEETAFRVTNGVIADQFTCPAEIRIETFSIIQQPRNSVIIESEEFALRARWTTAGGRVNPGGYDYSFTGTGLVGDTQVYNTTTGRTAPLLFTTRLAGEIRVDLVVTDPATGNLLGSTIIRIDSVTPSSRFPGGEINR